MKTTDDKFNIIACDSDTLVAMKVEFFEQANDPLASAQMNPDLCMDLHHLNATGELRSPDSESRVNDAWLDFLGQKGVLPGRSPS